MYGLKVKQINSSNRQRRTACSGMILVFAQFSSADVGKLPLLSAEVAIVGEKAEIQKNTKRLAYKSAVWPFTVRFPSVLPIFEEKGKNRIYVK